MSTCYLCGNRMVDKPKDYNTNQNEYKQLAIKHEEHIVQNALYGRLTNSNILCESCGGKLAKDIDTEFNKIFYGITEQLKHILAPKDHGNNNLNRALHGYLFKKDGTNINVLIKEGKVTPEKPEYQYIPEESKVNIYCSKKKAKEYKRLVDKELLEKGVEINNIKFEIIDDISHLGNVGIFFSEGITDFNKKFKLGLNKIATGFAASHGINREFLPCTIDTTNKKIVFTNNVIPFYPYSAFDSAIEPLRVEHEDEYPTHTLILYTDSFSDKKKLVCYIDLFSTFQYYVILNHNYSGNDICKTYYQTILKQEKPEIQIRQTRMKHLNILAELIDVKLEELNDKSPDEKYSYLETKYRQMTVSYDLDLNEYIRQISYMASLNLILKSIGTTNILYDIEKAESYQGINNLISIKYELDRIENQDLLNYRQNYLESAYPSYIHSTLSKMIEICNKNPEKFKDYGHFKFYELYKFITQNKPSK